MEYFKEFGFAGLLLAGICYLAGKLFYLWLKLKEREHQRVLDSQNDFSLQKFKAELDALNRLEEIKFTNLHPNRAEVIKELYVLLKTFYYTVYAYSPGRNKDQVKEDAAFSSLSKATMYFDNNELLFKKEHSDKIKSLIDELRNITFDKSINATGYNPNYRATDEEVNAMKDRWEKLHTDIPRRQEELTAIFRNLLGVE